MVHLFWLLAYRLDLNVRIEWVDSISNWSGGISRDHGLDKWSLDNGFCCSLCKLDMAWWFKEVTEVMRSTSALQRGSSCELASPE